MTSLFSYSRLRPAPQCAPQCAPHCESSASSSCRRASNSEPQTPISESHRPAELRIRIPNIAGPARTLPTKLPVPHTECFPHHSRKSRLALSYLILSYPILPYLATPSAGLKSTADRQSASSPPGLFTPPRPPPPMPFGQPPTSRRRIRLRAGSPHADPDSGSVSHIFPGNRSALRYRQPTLRTSAAPRRPKTRKSVRYPIRHASNPE